MKHYTLRWSWRELYGEHINKPIGFLDKSHHFIEFKLKIPYSKRIEADLLLEEIISVLKATGIDLLFNSFITKEKVK